MMLRFRLRVFHIAPCIAAFLGHLAAADPPSGADAKMSSTAASARTRPPSSQPTVPPLQLQVICGEPGTYPALRPVAAQSSQPGADRSQPQARTEPARFTLRADGDLQVADPVPNPTSLSFTGFTGGAIARIEGVSSNKRTAWCAA